MAWDVEYTDEFEAWRVCLNEDEQIEIDAVESVCWKKKDRIYLIPILRMLKAPNINEGTANSTRRKTTSNPLHL